MLSLEERVKEANKLIESLWKYIAATDAEVYQRLVTERKKE